MKKTIAVILLSTLFAVCNSISTVASERKSINVKVNQDRFCFGEIQPIIRNGRTLVPLQCGIFEKFSAETEYDHIYKEVVIRTDTQVLTLYTNQFIIYDKGEKCYELDVTAEYINGQVYVPLRGFMEAMGKKVEYDERTNTAKVYLAF